MAADRARVRAAGGAEPAAGDDRPARWLELAAGWSAPYDLASGAIHRYHFHLDAGDFLRLVVEQIDTDAAASLLDPDGVEQLFVNSWNGTHGPEPVAVVARRSGTYRLEVRGDGPVGRYRLRIEARRAATARDRRCDRATRAFSQAEKLVAEGSNRHALERYRAAESDYRAAGETLRQAVALARIGWLHGKLRELVESSRAYRQSLERFQQSDATHRLVPWALDELATATKKQGERRAALATYEEALRIARLIGDGGQEVKTLSNIAVVYRSLGETRRAATYYELALARVRQLDDRAREARILANVSRLYSGLGELERARTLLLEALRLARRTSNASAEARALGALGTLQRRLGRLEASRGSLERSLALRRSLENRPGEARTLRELARTYFELAEHEASLGASEQALALARTLRDDRIEAGVTCDLGWFYHHARGDTKRALTHFRQARRLYRRLENRAGEASAVHGAALAERDRGELEAARSLIEEALAMVESLRTETDVVDLRSSYLASKQDYYELYIDLLIELDQSHPGRGHAAAALEADERRRARALLDVLARTVSIEAGSPRIRPGGEGSPAIPQLRLSDIRRLIDQDTLLLEYALGQARSFLWLVTPTDVECHHLPGRERLEELARRAYRLLRDSRDRKGRAQRRLISDQLSRLLLGPVRDRLGSKRLLVVADGALRYLPFGALPIPRGTAEEPDLGSGMAAPPLVTEHEIVYLPSLSVLAVLRRNIAAQAPAGGLLVVVADPVFSAGDPRVGERTPSPTAPDGGAAFDRLGSTLEEAEAILALVPEEQRLALLGFAANRQAVLAGALADYRFVHFATHGTFEARRPAFSGLVLSQVDQTGRLIDGYLRPDEIYGLRLSAEMVVLSACRTGLGKEVRGEGLVGLTQGFLYAGAARVLVSFWQVDDEATAELMTRLYRRIFDDRLAPAAALRAAQLSMLREPRWQAPYYWAGFFFQGEWR